MLPGGVASAFDRDKLEILLSDADNTIARYGNVMFQIRTGRMTLDALARIESTARLLRVRTTGPVGGFAVLEESATVVPRDVRERQREVLAGLTNDPRTHLASVIIGDGVRATLLRSVIRLIAPRRPRVLMAANLVAAATWLEGALGEPPMAELLAAVEHVRSVAREKVGH